MKKKIFIHIGFGKTGTSSIQTYLFLNRRNKNADYLYPEIGLKGNGHHDLAVLKAERFSGEQKQLYSELVTHLTNDNTGAKIILSSEYFCFTKPGYIYDVYQYLQSFDVRIIFYVRNQVDLIQSAYLQSQKVGWDYQGSIENYFEKTKKGFDFMDRVRPWAEYFGIKNIIARLYDKRVIGIDICKDFLKLTGTKLVHSSPLDVRTNESLLPEFSEIISLIDKGEVSSEEREKHINYFLELSSQFRGLSWASLIQHDLKEKIRESYVASNTEFAKHFLSDEQGKYLLDSF